LMVYYFRGDMPYEDLRPVAWYCAIPQLGAILFVAGWWSRRGPLVTPALRARLTRRGLLTVVIVSSGLVALHLPRTGRLLLAGAPPMTAAEADIFKVPELQRLRALYLADEHARRQRRALTRLEWVERIGRELGVGRETIRRTFGRVLVPGIPELQRESDAAALLALPASDSRPVDAAWLRVKLRDLMAVEVVPPHPWISSGKSETPRDLAPATVPADQTGAQSRATPR
jgi:hypothetical protein